jgi:hypothetical protein
VSVAVNVDVKTWRLYTRLMKLINVRLTADDARRVSDLRKAGVQLSRVVRDAIRAEHERRVRSGAGQRRVADIMAEIYAAYPDPPGTARRRFDLRDRVAARRAILRRLARRRS